ncbi:MAG: cation:proton antiporter [Bacteroidales bacterium]|nr:cation:proton antiporter [Bacteroidales bacterium]
MESLPALFSDLALILVTAGITTVIFKWLKQPLVLGYIIAGILIGPYFPWFPVVGDHESVETWSEIGMVFLLFAIGLEFSFKKLKKQAGTVGITALTELVSMCVIGFLLGKLLGWSRMDCIFLGAMLSMSSTTIIAKAFEDLKMKGEKFTGSVIGVLVVEDLAAILMMVILSTLAVSTTLNGSELLYSVIKLVFFLLVWYVGGVFIIPTILKWTRKFMSEETLTVFAVGLCFSMVWLANKAGFSSALGAFIMGSILAETLEAEMIHKLTTPIKNLFGALFFVSVGMMVNPVILVQYWWQVLVITVVVVVLKSLSSGIGMLFSGDNLRNSVRAGVCFGQIGEFSFIIATVGISFGVIDNFMYPIIVSVSIITTFLTPYLIKGGDPLYHWIERKFPDKFVKYLENKDKKIKKKNGKWVTFRSFIIGHFKSIVIYSFLVFALMLICFSLLSLLIGHTSIPMSITVLISLAVTLVVTSPLIWALGYKRELERDTIDSIMKKEASRRIVRFVYILRFILAWFLAFLVIRHYLDDKFWQSVGIQMNSIIMATVAALAYMLLMRGISPAMKWYERIEARFLDNFNKRQAQHSFILPTVLQDNFTMEKMSLSPKSTYIGKSIRHCDFYSAYNITVVCVERADEFYDLPRRDFVLFPSDIITFLGTEEELGKLRPFVEVEDEVLVKERPVSEMEIHYSVVSEGSNYLGVSLHDTDLRNRYNALVIAVERDDDFILNPAPSVVFQKDDTVWFVATEAKAEALLKEAYVNEQ